MQIFRDIRAGREDEAQRSEVTLAVDSLDARGLKRKRTSWWKPARYNSYSDGTSDLHNKIHEVDMYLKVHKGEARVWQNGPEEWIPLDGTKAMGGAASGAALLDLDRMGMTYKGIAIGRTQEECTAEFYKSESCSDQDIVKRRIVMEFGPHGQPAARGQYASVEQPNLNDAVSTLIVRGSLGQRTKYWLRKVNVITLPEVFKNFQNYMTWFQLYKTWLEGACVIRAHPRRGTTAGNWRPTQSDRDSHPRAAARQSYDNHWTDGWQRFEWHSQQTHWQNSDWMVEQWRSR